MKPQDIIEKIIPKELMVEVYRDVAQPTLQKVGTALSSVASIVTTPITLGSSIFTKNIEIYMRKLEPIDPSKIGAASPEIAIPILQKLRYTSAPELVELYTELLLKASTKDTQSQVHPSYYEIITNLSTDEAKILHRIKLSDSTYNPFMLPYLTVKQVSKVSVPSHSKGGFTIMEPYFCKIDEGANLDSPQQSTKYIQNLIRLGILEVKFGNRLADEAPYAELENDPEIIKLRNHLKENGSDAFINITFDKGLLNLTAYGRGFIQTCVPKTL